VRATLVERDGYVATVRLTRGWLGAGADLVDLVAAFAVDDVAQAPFEVLTVGEHIAIVQRAQAIAATDHGALVRAQRELAEAHAEINRLRRRARRRVPATSGRRGLGRRQGTGR